MKKVIRAADVPQKFDVSLNDAAKLITYGAKISELSPKVDVIRWPPNNSLPNISSSEKLALVISKEKAETAPDEVKQLMLEVERKMADAAVAAKTTKNIAERCIKNLINTLGHMPGRAYVSSYTNPLLGIPAFVVCAGPSLDKNIDQLHDAAKVGVIIATNTSARALRKKGIPVDCVVSLESLDVSKKIAAGCESEPYPLAVLDMTSHPNNWTATRADEIVMAVNNDPSFFGPAIALGGTPLAYGGTVSSTAVAVARYWGAKVITMVGQDLAWTDGRGYATGTLGEEIRAEVIGEYVKFTGAHKDGMLLSYDMVKSWDGKGEVLTTADLYFNVPWFSRFNQSRAPFTDGLINATEGGIYMHGLPHIRLADVLRGISRQDLPYHDFRRVLPDATRPLPRVAEADVKAYAAGLRDQFDRIRAAATKYMRERGADNFIAYRSLVSQAPMIVALVIEAIYEQKEATELGPKQRYDIIIEATIQKTSDAIEAIGRIGM